MSGGIVVVAEPAGWVGLCPRLGHLAHAPVGVVVDHAPGALVVLHDGATTSTLDAGSCRDLVAGPVDVRGHRSSGWRLVALAAAAAGQRHVYDWDQAVLAGLGIGHATRTDDARRLFALDALDAARPELAVAAGLPQAETWTLLAAWHAAGGRVVDALDALRRVPPGRSVPASVVRVAARCWPRAATAADRTHLVELVAPWRAADPLAALLVALGRGPTEAPDPAALAGLVDALLGLTDGTGDAGRDAAARALLTACRADRGPDVDLAPLGPIAAVFGAARSLQPGAGAVAPADVPLAGLLAAPPAVVDDLVDAGIVGPRTLDGARDVPDGLVARVAPERLGDVAVSALGLADEALRRTAATGDLDALAAAPGSPLRDRLLLAAHLRAGDRDGARAIAPALDDGERAVLDALVGALDAGAVPSSAAPLFADRTTWPLLADLDVGRMRPHRVEGDARRFLAWRTLRAARDHLWSGRSTRALATARDLLAWADDEAVRAEALNLAACAHWLAGEDREAMQALLAALDLRHTEALAVNLGIVGGLVEPALAAEHLAELAVDAPTADLAVGAGLAAAARWQRAVADGAVPPGPPPGAVLAALRRVVGVPLALDRFRAVLRSLAVWDPDWVDAHPDLGGSPHASSLEAEVYRARAAGVVPFVRAIAAAVGPDGAPAWARRERDGLVAWLVPALLEEPPDDGALEVAGVALDAGMALDPEGGALLNALVARTRLGAGPPTGAPDLAVVRLGADAARALASLDGPARERLAPLVRPVVDDVVARTLAGGRAWLSSAASSYRDVAEPLRDAPAGTVDGAAVRAALEPIVAGCAHADVALGELVGVLVGEEQGLLLDGLRAKHRELLAAITRLTGTLA